MFEDERPTGTSDTPAGTTDDEDRDDEHDLDDDPDAAADGEEGDDSGGSDAEDSPKIRELNKRLGAQLREAQEKARAAEQRLADAERQRQPSATGAQQPGTDRDAERQLQEDLRLEAEAEALAAADQAITPKHFAAKTRLDRARFQHMLNEQREQSRRSEIASVPEEIRKDVEDLMRSEGVSRALAERLVKAERGIAKMSEKTTDKDRAERERRDAARALRDQQPDLTRRGVTAREVRDRMTKSDYRKEMDRLAEKDDFEARLELKRRRDTGKIKVSG